MPIWTIGSADGEPSTAEAIAPSIRSTAASSESRSGSRGGGRRASNPFQIQRKTQETPYSLGKSAVCGGQNGSQNAWQNAKRLAVRLAVESQTSRRMSSSRHFETVRPDDLTPRQRRGGAWRLEARIPGDHLYSVPAAPAHALAGRGQIRGPAATAPFSDDPIVPGLTPVRAVHFTELRTRIDALRSAAGRGSPGPTRRRGRGTRGSRACICSSCGRRWSRRTERRVGRRRAGRMRRRRRGRRRPGRCM